MKYIDRVDFSVLNLPKEIVDSYLSDSTAPRHLVFARLLVKLLDVRFDRVYETFMKDQVEFNNNLVHGLITTLSLFLQNLRKDPWNALLAKPEHTKHHQRMLYDLNQVIIKVLDFATNISAENTSTYILDNEATKKTMESYSKDSLKMDCRGHVRKDVDANTFLESLGEVGAVGGGEEFDTDNTIVVAFFLMTREAGLLFQQYASLLVELEKVRIPSE